MPRSVVAAVEVVLEFGGGGQVDWQDPRVVGHHHTRRAPRRVDGMFAAVDVAGFARYRDVPPVDLVGAFEPDDEPAVAAVFD